MADLEIFPATLKEANRFVELLHRHHDPTTGHRWSIGVRDILGPIGYAIVGRPVARKTSQYDIAEVTRLVTDGTHNACSMLYGAAARAAKAMGYKKIQTFTLESENGASLRAAGWICVGRSNGLEGWQSRAGRNKDQPTEPKLKWEKVLCQTLSELT